MLAKITNKDAKYYLEPSAGKGDIADVIKQSYTFEEFCEENPEYNTVPQVIGIWAAMV